MLIKITLRIKDLSRHVYIYLKGQHCLLFNPVNYYSDLDGSGISKSWEPGWKSFLNVKSL